MEWTIRDVWPDDPRWGNGYIKPPLGGVYDESYRQYVEDLIELEQQTVAYYTEKYPDTAWWAKDFVDAHPAVALLLQSVNDQRVFASQAVFKSLVDLVEKLSLLPATPPSEYYDVQIARLAFSAIINGDKGGGELELAHSIMTETDRQELFLLLAGQSRVPTKGL